MEQVLPNDQDKPSFLSPASGVKRIAITILVFIALGLPLDDLIRFFILIGLLVIVFSGWTTKCVKRWAIAFSVSVSAIVLRIMIPDPGIVEGSNMLAIYNEPNPLMEVIPEDIYALASRDMHKKYPSVYNCRNVPGGCGHGAETVREPFAKSVEILWDPVSRVGFGWTRKASKIAFNDALDLAPSFIALTQFNWYKSEDRPSRDSPPFITRFHIPFQYDGMEFCARGDVFFEPVAQLDGQDGPDENNDWIRFSKDTEEFHCQLIEIKAGGRDVIGYSVGRGDPLSMHLDRPFSVVVFDILETGASLFAAIFVVGLLVKTILRRVVAWYGLCVTAFVIILFFGPRLLLGRLVQFGGGDGLTHESFGRDVFFHALAGDWVSALRGGVDVFYYMPGMRYFRALESVFFGESEFALVLCLVVLPVVTFFLLRCFIEIRAAAIATTIFTGLNLGKYFGFSFYRYVAEAQIGHAEPVGYPAFYAGILIAIVAWRRIKSPTSMVSTVDGSHPKRTRVLHLFLCSGLLFACALFLRPNLAPGIAVFCILLSVPLLRSSNVLPVIIWAIGVSFSLLMLLHNVIFGGEWILFTSASEIPANLKVSPSVYWRAILEVSSGVIDGENLIHVLNHLSNWFGPVRFLMFGMTAMIAFRVLNAPYELRAIAFCALAQHAVLWLYHAHGRYEFAAWYLTVIVVLCWVAHRRLTSRAMETLVVKRLAKALGVQDMGARLDLVHFLSLPTDRMSMFAGFKTVCRPLASPMLQTIEALKGKKSIYDIGCGTGALLSVLRDQDPTVRLAGSEMSDDALRQSRFFDWSRGEVPKFERATSEPPILEGYDTVTLNDVLHHIPKIDQQRFLNDLGKNISIGSILVLTDIDAAAGFRRACNQLHDLVFAGQWVHPLTSVETESYLEKAGFRIREKSVTRSLWYQHYILVAERIA